MPMPDKLDHLKPLAVLLVAKGTKGDRMLFLYPFGDEPTTTAAKPTKCPYAVVPAAEDVFHTLSRLSEQIMAFLFTSKPEMCGQKFEVKINDVRFVSHPILLNSGTSSVASRASSDSMAHMLQFNVVFALWAEAPRSVALCFYDLSKRLGIALQYEEARTNFLSHEAKIMVECHEEVQTLTEDMQQSPYRLIMQKSQLANDVAQMFNDVCNTGIVHLYVNRFVELSFCLPQKVHNWYGRIMQPADLMRCFEALRPYHGMLLLSDAKTVIESLPLDASPALVRLLSIYNPTRSFQRLSVETDLPLSQVLQLVAHLVYWGKATLIYPLCETNTYLISPCIDLNNSSLADSFSDHFLGQKLWVILSEFSSPISLSDFTTQKLFSTAQQTERIEMVIWLLRQHLLIQQYTFIYLNVVSDDAGPTFFHQPHSSTSDSDKMRQSSGSASTSSNANGVGSVDLPAQDSLDCSFSDDAELNTVEQLLAQKLLKHLTIPEYVAVMRCVGARNTVELSLFARLCSYFRGKHSLEEIMNCENLKRSQISTIIGRFQDVLMTCQHEDQLEEVLHQLVP